MMEYIRERALKGEYLAGAWCNLGNPLTVEMAGVAGFDWVMIDQEHGVGDNMTLLHQVQAVARFPTTVLLRVPWVDRILYKKALDIGVGGILTPFVQTAAEAREVVRFTKYPPMGERGVASSPRCADFASNFADYFENANSRLINLVQIETGKAVENAEEIAAVDGIDVLLIGPMDLSISTGLRKQVEDPAYVKLLEHVAKAARSKGKAAGFHCPNMKWLPMLKEFGYTFIASGTDGGYVMNTLKSTLTALREG
ncbi:MAG: hypothetical protein LBR29_08065 [Methylobacteriaceae bacterium]|jgi:2-keto-3-deoxy-L-rhamnonate aldolase RhmA|nr:hypothetical protein [Methylobacteriaceae bacterium]